jgi:hypothetical protein
VIGINPFLLEKFGSNTRGSGTPSYTTLQNQAEYNVMPAHVPQQFVPVAGFQQAPVQQYPQQSAVMMQTNTPNSVQPSN